MPPTPHEISPGYVCLKDGARAAVVRAADAERIAAALWHGEHTAPVDAGGRGSLLRFECAEGRGLIRRYRRGGVVRHVARDRFFCDNRAWREFRVLRYAEVEGLSVPRVLGVAWFRSGPWYRGAIATAELDGPTLDAWLSEAHDDPGETLCACGAMIREFHDHGVWHADLQVRNILITPDGPYLIDFDNAVLARRLGPIARHRNLLRLRRSFEKNGHALMYFRALCEGYGAESPPGWLDAAYVWRCRASDWLAGRHAGDTGADTGRR